MSLIQFEPTDEIDVIDKEQVTKFMNTYNINAFREYDYESAPIILVYYADSIEIEKYWFEIVNDFGCYFQSNITEEFLRRNITLFFMCKDELSHSLKQSIQRDVYACRKVVFDKVIEPSQILSSYYLYGYSAKSQLNNLDDLKSIIENKFESVYRELSNENK